MIRRHLCAVLLICSCHTHASRAEFHRAIDHVVIDGTKIPYGTAIEIMGPCLSTDSMSLQPAGASLHGLRINGKPTQEIIDFNLHTSRAEGDASHDLLSTLTTGTYYKVRGRLMNARSGGKRNAASLVVERIEPTIGLTAAVDCETTLEGIAAPAGTFRQATETATVEGLAAWPAGVDGKRISIHGTIRRGQTGWQIDRPTWQLIDLEDLVDREVSLDGTLWGMWEIWTFDYRGTSLYLMSNSGPALNFNSDHGRKVRVIGKLLRQNRPSYDSILGNTAYDLVPCFVVRCSKVVYLDDGSGFDTLYPSFHTARDGVPELLPEESLRNNELGNEKVTTRLYAERNREAIDAMIRDVSPATRDVLVRRMNDANVTEPLRLLYAAVLARVNDDRGRSFLLNRAEVKDQNLDLDPIYCLGAFPFLAREQTHIKTEVSWAVKPMIALLTNRKRATVAGIPLTDVFWTNAPSLNEGPALSVADAVVKRTSIPSVLSMSKSDEARKALLDYAASKSVYRSFVVATLCSAEPPLPLNDLLALKGNVDDYSNRAMLSLMLRHKYRAGIARFLTDLPDRFVYLDLRDHLSPEVVAELRAGVERLTGTAKIRSQMLTVLGQKDPVPALLALLDDPKWLDKELVLFELNRLGDPRAVAVVARVLRESPKDYFSYSSAPGLVYGTGVEHGLAAIAHAGTAEAIRELIELLTVDLSRFGSRIGRRGLQGIVHVHLIELTGESLGIDADAWRKWQQAHPDFSASRELANSLGVFRSGGGGNVDPGN